MRTSISEDTIGGKFVEGDKIFYYFKLKKQWVEATVLRLSKLIFEIVLNSGNFIKTHLRLIKRRSLGSDVREEESGVGMQLRSGRKLR